MRHDDSEVAEVELTAEAEAELQSLIERAERAILEALGEVGGEDVCWVCLYSGQDDRFVVTLVLVGRAGDRATELADLDLDEAWAEAWTDGWCREEDELDVAVPADWAPALLACLEGRVLDPPRWIAMRIARRLNEVPLPPALPRTDDFLVFVLNPEFGDDLIDELRFAAPPETYALLRQRRLIGEPEAR